MYQQNVIDPGRRSALEVLFPNVTFPTKANMTYVMVNDLFQLGEYFVAKPKKLGRPTSTDTQLNHSYTEIEGLTKALMYERYVKARTLAENNSISDIVKRELHHYPYNKKRKFQVEFMNSLKDTENLT